MGAFGLTRSELSDFSDSGVLGRRFTNAFLAKAVLTNVNRDTVLRPARSPHRLSHLSKKCPKTMQVNARTRQVRRGGAYTNVALRLFILGPAGDHGSAGWQRGSGRQCSRLQAQAPSWASRHRRHLLRQRKSSAGRNKRSTRTAPARRSGPTSCRRRPWTPRASWRYRRKARALPCEKSSGRALNRRYA